MQGDFFPSDHPSCTDSRENMCALHVHVHCIDVCNIRQTLHCFAILLIAHCTHSINSINQLIESPHSILYSINFTINLYSFGLARFGCRYYRHPSFTHPYHPPDCPGKEDTCLHPDHAGSQQVSFQINSH